MKLLACGGRYYVNRDRLFATLDAIHARTPVTLLIHGAARGADSLAKDWAVSRLIPHEAHHADWSKHGFDAGPLRNAKMLTRAPALVVAFPGGKGTAHMVRIARGVGVEVLEVQ